MSEIDSAEREAITVGCDLIAAALARAFGTLENPPRNRTVTVPTKSGGSYTYSYATLDAVLDEVRPKLAAVGIAILQLVRWRGGKAYLVTRLLHSSGQMVEDDGLPLSAEDDGRLPSAKAFGSALTYMRRYGLSMIPIAAEYDDDGAEASGSEVSSKEDRPPCPKCGKNSKAIPSKFPKAEGEMYCLACKASFVPGGAPSEPAPAREPGEDDGPPLGHGEQDFEPLARIPARKSADYRSVAALGAELLRLTGDKPAAMQLLSDLCGASTLAGMPPREVGPAWEALAKHAKWGRP